MTAQISLPRDTAASPPSVAARFEPTTVSANGPTDLGRFAPPCFFLFGLLPYASTVKWPPIPSFWAEWIAVVLGGGAAFALASLRKSGLQARSVPLVVLACVACGIAIGAQLAFRWMPFTGAPLLVLGELALAAALCTTAANIRANKALCRAALDAWAWGLMVALLLNALEVLAERNGYQIYLYRFVPREQTGRATGLLGQWNQLAVFSVMAWCGAQYLWMRGKLPSALLLGAALLVGLNDAAAASRAGAIVFAASTALGWWICRLPGTRPGGQRLLVYAALLFLAMQVVLSITLVTTDPSVTVLRSDTALRIELLRDALALTERHPLTGVGFGNFSAARWQELSWAMGEPLSNHSHNAITQLAAELGVVAMVVIVVPVAFAIFLALRSAMRRLAAPEDFFVAAIVCVIGGYSLTEYPLWYTFFLLPFAFISGLVEQPVLRIPSVQKEQMKLLRNGIWSLALLAAIAVGVDYRRLETIYVDASIQQSSTGRTDEGIELPTPQIRNISLLTAFDLYGDLMLSRTLAINGRLMEDKLPITERVLGAYPTWETAYRHIAFLVYADKVDEAKRVWSKVQRNPQLEADTYQALRRQAPNVPGLKDFVAGLHRPAALPG